MQNQKKICATIILSLILAVSFLSFFEKGTFLSVVFASDVHGNQINWVSVEQWNTTSESYVLVENFTSSGQSTRVHDSWVVRFKVGLQFNNTLASSTSQAIEYTRVYMNITGIWTDQLLNNTSCVLSGSWYLVIENGVWNQTGKPEAGEIYECTAKYEGYY